MRAKGPAWIVAAHPDDETIGLGGHLARLRDVFVLHVTDGSPRNLKDARANGFMTREDYARARRREAVHALSLAGLHPTQCKCLGAVDQEASFELAGITRELARWLEAACPAAVFTHPYEGGHPDHDAVAFAVHAACRILQAPIPVIEFTSYHRRAGALAVGEFLPSRAPVTTVSLCQAERERKRLMLSCFETQSRTLRPFVTGIERFRPAPCYDFSQPPHNGPLFYESFDWGMSGERWRRLAVDALASLP